MFPVYGYFDPCYQPYQMEPNSYSCRSYPGWQVMPPQMKAESLKHPSPFVPCSFSNNMVPPNSGGHNTCCAHSCSPGYYTFRPQFSHIQPASQLYSHGPYPPYPGSYPAYFVPPPHYSVDQPRYDYDKAREHCCGCPNHACNRRDDSHPRVQEQRPEKERDRDSLGLIWLPNYPSPVVWLPASSIKDKEGGKETQLQPVCWNHQTPMNISGLNELKEEDEGKKGQQDEDKLSSHKESPFPVIWIPEYHKSEGPTKDSGKMTTKSAEGWPSMFKIIPLKLLENENKGEEPKTAPEEPKSGVQEEAPTQTESKIRTIPVKTMEEGSKIEASITDKQEGNVEKPKEENELTKASGKKEPSPVRSSKLPPVCLRVDPLPRKKTNGSSRSPSPPGHKDRKDHQRKEVQSPRSETSEDVFEKVIPVVSVKDSMCSQPDKERKLQDALSVASLEDSSRESPVQETVNLKECLTAGNLVEGSQIGGEKDSGESMSAGESESDQKIDGDKIERDNRCAESSDKEEKNEKKGMRRHLSENDAALIIQSAYRGYEVRKWRPLEKLQKIARVREQVGNVKRQIESIESSSMCLDAKQKMVIGEVIMSLLLQLDTIQGLHPSVREARKCVARELVCLQEKLDSLIKPNAKEHGSTAVEAMTKATDEAASGESGVGDSKGESLEDEINSSGNAATKVAAECVVNHGDLPSNVEAVDVMGSSALREPMTDQELVQPPEDIGVEAEPSSGNTGTDGSVSDITIVASPSLAFETVSDEGTELSEKTELRVQPATSKLVQTANENGASENLFSQDKESGSEQETIEDMKKEEGLVPTANENGASENPSSEEKKSASSELDALEELRRGEGLVTDQPSGPAIASFLVSKLAPEDALYAKCLSKSSEESEYQQHEAAPFDHSFEGDAYGYRKLEEPLVQTSEQDDNTGKLTFDAEDKPESEIISSLENTGEEVPTPLPVDSNDDDILMPVQPEADAVKEAMSESLEVSGCQGVAENNDEGPMGGDDKIEGAAGDVHLVMDKDAMNEVGVGHALDVGQETSALALNEGMNEQAEVPVQNVERCGIRTASEDVNKEEKKILEENEKLKEMLEKLLDAGKEQLGVILDLNGRVKDLERKIAQKRRKIKVKRNRAGKLQSCGASC